MILAVKHTEQIVTLDTYKRDETDGTPIKRNYTSAEAGIWSHCNSVILNYK